MEVGRSAADLRVSVTRVGRRSGVGRVGFPRLFPLSERNRPTSIGSGGWTPAPRPGALFPECLKTVRCRWRVLLRGTEVHLLHSIYKKPSSRPTLNSLVEIKLASQAVPRLEYTAQCHSSSQLCTVATAGTVLASQREACPRGVDFLFPSRCSPTRGNYLSALLCLRFACSGQFT